MKHGVIGVIKNITNLDSLISGSKAPIRDLSMNKILMLNKLSGVVDQLVSGTAPITLANAANRAIKSLVQTGLCTQASTPTPSAPVPIKCNNGEIKFGKPLTIDSTRIYGSIGTSGSWTTNSNSYSIAVPVAVGKEYAIRMTETASDTVGTILRYGFTDSATPSGQTLSQWVRTTPQDTQFAELTADEPYLVIQMQAAQAAGNLTNGYVIVQEQTIYVDGTPEVLTVMDADSNTQTASVESLFSVGTYADEQEVIGGTVWRNVGVKALDGTESWTKSSSVFVSQLDGILKPPINITGISTHYQGTNATNANMPDNSIKITYSGSNGVVAIKSTAYSTKDEFAAYLAAQYAAGTPVIIVYPLATPTTEQVAAQPLTTAVGTNTVSVTAEVSSISLECKYKKNK